LASLLRLVGKNKNGFERIAGPHGGLKTIRSMYVRRRGNKRGKNYHR
jgi:hypothetical protein